MENIEYKGYIGSVHYDNEEKIYYGKVLNIRSLISYQGVTYDGLVKDFHKAIIEYLDFTDGGSANDMAGI